MGIVGLTVGIFTAWGQPWLVRQRSGMVLRFWRPLTIISYTIAGIALSPFVNYYEHGTASVALSQFAWFLIPALLPALSLRRIVQGAWQWVAAGIGMATLVAGSYFILPVIDSYTNWHPFSMLFGTVAASFASGMLMVRLLNQSRVDTQLSANATTVSNEVSEVADETHGYLHHVPYMLLWLMTQAVGWAFVALSFGLVWLAVTLIPPLQDIFNQMHAAFIMGGSGLVYGVFSAWAQPWLMRLRTGQQVQHWRPLTVIATTLTAALSGFVLQELTYNSDYFNMAVVAGLSAWFVAPAILQTWSLRKAGKNIWLWPLAGGTSAAVAVMILNQVSDFYGSGYSGDYAAYAMYGIGFGLLVQVILSGLMSLQILEAPRDDEDDDADKAAKAQSNLNVQRDAVPNVPLLLSAEVEPSEQRLQTDS